MTGPLIDIGANLTHDSFARDIGDVLRRAAMAGVSRIVVTGSSLADSRQAITLCRDYPERLVCTAGIHPHHAATHGPEDLLNIEALIDQPEVRAVGETGLDYNRNFSPRADQLRIFEAQLQIAAQTARPVFLHEREAHEDFIGLIRKYRDQLPAAVVHCFTGTEDELRAYLDLDLYVGLTGWICDERRGAHLHDMVSLIPDHRLMIETDAPYLLPRDLSPRPRSRRNEPAYLPHVLHTLARVRRQDEDELAALTGENARRFFHLN